MSDVTQILQAIEHGDAKAADELLPLVLAAQKMAREQTGHTLQATALVHEAWLRLGDGVFANGRARHYSVRAARGDAFARRRRARSDAPYLEIRRGSQRRLTSAATNFTTAANHPNGLCFSPDESKLYLVDTEQRAIVAYDVLADGTLTNSRIFATVGPEPQWPDGIRCDRAGRIFCTVGGAGAQSGVRIYDPNGQLLGTIRTLEFVTNLCFGGSNQEMIFVTAGDGVYGITRMPDLIVTGLYGIPATPPQANR